MTYRSFSFPSASEGGIEMMASTWRSPIRLGALTLAAIALTALGFTGRAAWGSSHREAPAILAGPVTKLPGEKLLLGAFNHCPSGSVAMQLSFRNAITGDPLGSSDHYVAPGQGAVAVLNGSGLGPGPVHVVGMVRPRINGTCELSTATLQVAATDASGNVVAITRVISGVRLLTQ
jgi:hypothetical protein